MDGESITYTRIAVLCHVVLCRQEISPIHVGYPRCCTSDNILFIIFLWLEMIVITYVTVVIVCPNSVWITGYIIRFIGLLFSPLRFCISQIITIELSQQVKVEFFYIVKLIWTNLPICLTFIYTLICQNKLWTYPEWNTVDTLKGEDHHKHRYSVSSHRCRSESMTTPTFDIVAFDIAHHEEPWLCDWSIFPGPKPVTRTELSEP